MPEKLLSANAYLGAEPIARALSAGADVVITGRCVDSAVTLGPLIHHFGWTMDQYDQLAGGSLVGHILECGCQATGGLFTDWQSVPDWAHIGYPIAQVEADGSFTVSKAPGTGGLISPATVGEQLLYEIGDPGAYLLPDVACDFRQVQIEQTGENRVRVAGAKGSAPTPTLKVSATNLVGWRCDGMTVIVGIDAVAKARRTGQSLVERTREVSSQGTKNRMAIEPISTALPTVCTKSPQSLGPWSAMDCNTKLGAGKSTRDTSRQRTSTSQKKTTHRPNTAAVSVPAQRPSSAAVR